MIIQITYANFTPLPQPSSEDNETASYENRNRSLLMVKSQFEKQSIFLFYQ